MNVGYGVKSNQVLPDDIRWDAGIQVTMTPGYNDITISGVKLNAYG